MATSEHVSRVLLDATGPLAELHRRVLEAGCEVDPEWKLGRLLQTWHRKTGLPDFSNRFLKG